MFELCVTQGEKTRVKQNSKQKIDDYVQLKPADYIQKLDFL